MIESSRSHQTRVAIDAPIEEVWKAITDPEALARWFAPKMTVEPEVGGRVVADWGPGLEWKTAIEVWEENRHLRLVETRDQVMTASPVKESLEPRRLVEDFYLESEGGRTVLRLVHSGFGSSRDWDVEYEGTRGGWLDCFFRLRLGMERHRGETTLNHIVPVLCHGIGAAGALTAIEAAVPGPFEVENRGAYHLCGVLPALNGSVLTISVQPAAMGSVGYVELLLFGMPGDRAAGIVEEWRERLGAMFPAPAAQTA